MQLHMVIQKVNKRFALRRQKGLDTQHCDPSQHCTENEFPDREDLSNHKSWEVRNFIEESQSRQ